MAEQITDAPAAESSPAPSQVLESFTPQQRQEWLKTGELPGAKPAENKGEEKSNPQEPPTSEASAPSGDASGAVPKADEKAAASEPAKTQTQEHSKGEERKARLAAEIQDLLRQRAELRREVQTSKEAKTTAPPAEKTSDKPTPDKFTTYEEYVEALADWKAEQKGVALINQFKQEQEQAAKKAQQDEAFKQAQEHWKAQVEKAIEKHPDFVEVALAKESPIPENSIPDGFLAKSEHGADILYHLSKNPDEIKSILKLDPFDQVRALIKLEVSLSEAPAKTVTSAPPPAKELGGRSTNASDPATEAVKAKNFRAYKEAMDRREHASRKG